MELLSIMMMTLTSDDDGDVVDDEYESYLHSNRYPKHAGGLQDRPLHFNSKDGGDQV